MGVCYLDGAVPRCDLSGTGEFPVWVVAIWTSWIVHTPLFGLTRPDRTIRVSHPVTCHSVCLCSVHEYSRLHQFTIPLATHIGCAGTTIQAGSHPTCCRPHDPLIPTVPPGTQTTRQRYSRLDAPPLAAHRPSWSGRLPSQASSPCRRSRTQIARHPPSQLVLSGQRARRPV